MSRKSAEPLGVAAPDAGSSSFQMCLSPGLTRAYEALLREVGVKLPPSTATNCAAPAACGAIDADSLKPSAQGISSEEKTNSRSAGVQAGPPPIASQKSVAPVPRGAHIRH